MDNERKTSWQLTEQEEQQIRQMKQHLHEYPELSFQEYETTAYIKEILKTIPHVEILDFPMETGVVARLTGNKPGMTIGLRADIDAIEQTEDKEHLICSKKPGLMHACGHDFHTAALIGTAYILSRNQDQVPGTVYFIFQPAEENTKGAEKMLEAGLLELTQVEMLFASHNRPEIAAGNVVVHAGGLMAAKNNFRILLHGQGGHGSMPHKCVDPLVCAAAIIQALQTVISRNTDPLDSMVLTIGSIHGGSLENLVVDEVSMTGSMRMLSEKLRERALRRVGTIIRCTAEAYECTADFIIEQTLPLCDNKAPMVRIAQTAAEATVGEEHVVDSEPTLASEDYSLMMTKVPSFLYWVGSGSEGPCYSWHQAKFRTNDDGMKVGAELFAQSVLAANCAENGKNPWVLITFHTTTESIAMEKTCEELGLPGRLIPVPGFISAGCGMAWRSQPEEEKRLIEEMKKKGLKWEKIYQIKM